MSLLKSSCEIHGFGTRSTPHTSNDTAVSQAAPVRPSDPLTNLLRAGARWLIEAAVSAEFEEFLSAFAQENLPDVRQRVVRHGHLPERKGLTELGEEGVRVPKVHGRSDAPSSRRPRACQSAPPPSRAPPAPPRQTSARSLRDDGCETHKSFGAGRSCSPPVPETPHPSRASSQSHTTKTPPTRKLRWSGNCAGCVSCQADVPDRRRSSRPAPPAEVLEHSSDSAVDAIQRRVKPAGVAD